MEKSIYNKMCEEITSNIVSVWDGALENVGDGIYIDILYDILEKYIKIEDDRETEV